MFLRGGVDEVFCPTQLARYAILEIPLSVAEDGALFACKSVFNRSV
jgi:hypothetical protein